MSVADGHPLGAQVHMQTAEVKTCLLCQRARGLSLVAAQTRGLQNSKGFVEVPELGQKSGLEEVEGLSSQEPCTCYQVVLHMWLFYLVICVLGHGSE